MSEIHKLCGGLTALAVLLSVVCGCRTVEPSSPAAAWSEGPVRWLLLPDEAQRFRRSKDGREAVAFIEAFWRRRDREPASPGNPCLELFHERVVAADQLYAEERRRGALTDRGRALILLGPPPVLRYGQGTPPAGAPPTFGPIVVRRSTETWEYPLKSLTPELQELVLQAQANDLLALPIVLRFNEGPRRTRLITDDRILILAARSLVARR
jgi:GWxTD domain-containing protein